MVNTTVTFTGTVESQIRRGFTLIEMMVVLGVISIIAMVAFYGLSQYNNTQPLFNAQKEFLTALRALQNQVNNGSDGVSVKSLIFNKNTPSSYTIVNSYITTASNPSYSVTTINLPSGVTLYSVGGTLLPSLTNPTAICLSNPNLFNFDTNQICVTDVTAKRGCASGVGFTCTDGTTPSVNSISPFEIVLNQGAAQKKVVLEGSGMKINRIYAQ